MPIPFNRFTLTGKELRYLEEALRSERLSGDGPFTRRCHELLQQQFGFRKVFLTTSCTHALEMAALLAGIREGDEVILPSYTFVSTANAFLLRGARLVFADSGPLEPNLDVDKLGNYLSDRTRAVVPVHYAGVACDMDALMSVATAHGFWVIEDAAQCIGARHRERPLGGIGHFGCFSFHDTKNITCGEGGFIAVNRSEYARRAEIIREKGTDRAAFYRGEIDKYGWVDLGSSYLLSDLLAAFLLAQLEAMEAIQVRRRHVWDTYFRELSGLGEKGLVSLPHVPSYARHNAHVFYLVCHSGAERDRLMDHLRSAGIQAPFHYLSLHRSAFFRDKYRGPELPNSDRYSECLIRLPLYPALTAAEQECVITRVKSFFRRGARSRLRTQPADAKDGRR